MRIFALLIVLIGSLQFLQAQDFPPPPPPEDEIPVDGGIGMLAAIGAAWGIKKLKEKK